MKRQKWDKYIKKERDNGFTLVEVLVAILILTVGLLGMASLTVAIIQGNKFSSDLTTATTLAQDKMEEIRRIRQISYLNIDDEAIAVCSSPYEEFKREVVVDENPPGMKTVTVTVYWGGASKEDHEVVLETILAQ